MRAKFHVTDFKCSTCGARAGSVCRSKRTTKVVPFHAARVLAAAEAVKGA